MEALTQLPKTNPTQATPAATPPPVAPAPAPAAAASPPVQPAPAANPPPPLVTGGGTSTSSTGSTHSTKVDVEAQFQAVIAGLLAYYQPTDPFLMSDGTFTRDQLIARFHEFVSAVEQTKSDYQIWRTDVASEQALLTQVTPLRAGVRGIVQARFSKQGPQVLQFGFTPVKPPVRSAASKALAAEKAAATRKARGTVGKTAKAAIHGTVPAAARGRAGSAGRQLDDGAGGAGGEQRTGHAGGIGHGRPGGGAGTGNGTGDPRGRSARAGGPRHAHAAALSGATG